MRAHKSDYAPPVHFLKITEQNASHPLCDHLSVGQGVGPKNHRDATGPIIRHTDLFPVNRDLLI